MSETLTELNAGNSSRASHVWKMTEPRGPYVARRPWWSTPEVSPFMAGLVGLCAVDPRDLDSVASAYAFWHELNAWEVPRTLGFAQVQGAPALLVEWAEGDPAQALTRADGAELGQRVARAHARTLDRFGPLTGLGTRGWPVSEFYTRALSVLDALTTRHDVHHWAASWPEARKLLVSAPVPITAVPMLLDWSGDQFVWRDGRPAVLVDVEASAYAPPELDLCLWEVLLTAHQCAAFKAAYSAQLTFPDLTPHRDASRLILRVLEVEGRPALTDWLSLPTHFHEISNRF